MPDIDRLDQLRAKGRTHWLDDVQAWRAEPAEVVHALAAQGFDRRPPSARDLSPRGSGGGAGAVIRWEAAEEGERASPRDRRAG
jgi:hypothetical protein